MPDLRLSSVRFSNPTVWKTAHPHPNKNEVMYCFFRQAMRTENISFARGREGTPSLSSPKDAYEILLHVKLKLC